MSGTTSTSTPVSGTSAAERDRVGGRRDDAAERRDDAADLRDEAGARRDRVGEHRDEAARARDRAGDVRDDDAGRRDLVADLRDDAAATRDRQAEARDRAALELESVRVPRQGGRRAGDEAAIRNGVARREAAGDRQRAADDRRAAARERLQAEADRGTAGADRRSGAVERRQAHTDRDRSNVDRDSGADGRIRSAGDRDSACADRGQSSVDLTHASLDGLTCVYTRSAGLLELQREIDRAHRSGAPLMLAFLDVDGLKAVNDTGGHLAGDHVLQRVAEALQSALRPYDVVVRYGGDEFLCVLAEVTLHEAVRRLRRVNASLGEGAAPVSVSVGMAELRPADTMARLIERADVELYRQRRVVRQG